MFERVWLETSELENLLRYLNVSFWKKKQPLANVICGDMLSFSLRKSYTE